MQCYPTTKAGRRYVYRLAPTMAIYLVFLFIAQWSFHHLHPTGLIVYVLAVLPALPLIGSLAIVGLYISEESDEFERSILVQSMLWGFGGTLAVSTIFHRSGSGTNSLVASLILPSAWRTSLINSGIPPDR